MISRFRLCNNREHHHQRFSALGQVPGIHFLHLSLSPAIAFIFTYPSLFSRFHSFSLFSGSLFSSFFLLNASFRSLIIPILGYLSVSSPSLSPPSHFSINYPLSTYVLSNSVAFVLW